MKFIFFTLIGFLANIPHVIAQDIFNPFVDNNMTILAITIVAGQFISMLLVALVLRTGFKNLIKLQKIQISTTHKKDRQMRGREKSILCASLEGEMNSNQAKLDAFVIIYEKLLINLRDKSQEPKYKKGGDIIHKGPALSRNVYDANIDKMELLEPSLISDLSALYSKVSTNPDYRTIDPDTPVDDVIDFVSQIIRDAENLLAPMDKINGALSVIIRNQKSK